jgi:Uncharacterized protein containing SIS (Sugar ISomerase) phosphosugar binding domain
MNKDYLNSLRRLLDRLEETQENAVDRVSDICAGRVARGGLMYFFGTGHSHMICEEPFYRAGGLACVYPILETDLMLHEGASKSSFYERLPGLGGAVIDNSPLGENDVLFLISNSGRNAVIVDAALRAKEKGAFTVAITSINHSSSVTSRHPGGKRLFEVCDCVLDNGGVPGDACVTLEGLPQPIAPTSTVLDTTLVNLVAIGTAQKLLEKGIVPPVFLSANTDQGDNANKSIIEEYKRRIPLL